MGKAKTYSIRKPLKRYERSFDPASTDLPEQQMPEPEIIVQANITVNPGEKGPVGLTRTGRPPDTDADAAKEDQPPARLHAVVPGKEKPVPAIPGAMKKVRKKKPRRRGKLES